MAQRVGHCGRLPARMDNHFCTEDMLCDLGSVANLFLPLNHAELKAAALFCGRRTQE